MCGWVVGSLGALVGIVAGFLLAAEAELLREGYGAARSEAAVSMGFMKKRVPPPRIRLYADAKRKMMIAARRCPAPQDALVIVAGGQSNAANFIPTPYDATDAVSVWYDGECYPAADPLGGAVGDEGSLWSMMCDNLAKQTRRPVVLIVGAMGGSQFSDWKDLKSGLYAAR